MPGASLRRRLIVTFTGLTAAVIFLAAAILWVAVGGVVWSPLDGALGEEADAIARARAAEGEARAAEVAASIAGETDLGPGKFARIVAGDGRVIAESGAVVPRIAAAHEPSPGNVAQTIRDGDSAFRVVRFTTEPGDTVEVGVDASRQLRTLARLRRAIAVFAVAIVLALGALSWRITTRATRDLERLARELETIEAGSLDRRLEERRTAEANRLVAVLNRLLARLDAAMSHLRRFTADAAHELRTPVAALRAHLESSLAGPQSPDRLRDAVIDAVEQADRLGRLAEDLLTLSAVESGPAAPPDAIVRLDALARETFEFLQPVAHEDGRRFTIDAPEPVEVVGSELLLKRALLNLLDNAFRHNPHDAPVELTVRRSSGWATVAVRDEGRGIADGDLAQVFEPFRRGPTAAAGSGLGLAIAREIAIQHRGDLDLRSEPGRGTTAVLRLPIDSQTRP
ncbi:MAG TPA: HAMP domain-containing sensor histidine kinase [Candidatus Binatia bacterium]|nr:HAMP domain-containing sensor histidine kinase [Candidatus Binatia bacterium]